MFNIGELKYKMHLLKKTITLAATIFISFSSGIIAENNDRINSIGDINNFLRNVDTNTLISLNNYQPELDNTLSSVDKYPAFDLYKDSWSHDSLNPYRVAIDSMPDSLYINCKEFVYPTKSNRVTSRFGLRSASRFHYGVDIGLTTGDTVYASFSGKVRIVDYERRGYGHYVVVRHDNGFETVMAHLSKVLTKIDQEVKAGDPIGLGGNTGRSTGPHLHYEIRVLGNAFDPTKLIDIENRKLKTDEENVLISHSDTYSHNAKLKELKKAAYHRVRSGDTLSGIAYRYGSSVSQLCRLNGIKSTSILRIGQSIRYR